MYVWTFEIGEYIILHGLKIGLLTRLKIKHNFLHGLKAKNWYMLWRTKCI
jgi:hypothetical protein